MNKTTAHRATARVAPTGTIVGATFTVALALALAFTFSCTSDVESAEDVLWQSSSSVEQSSSSGTGNYDSQTAGRHLKAKSGWNNNGNGQDTYGFSALPGGNGLSDGSFEYVGYRGDWWSSEENGATYAYNRDIYYSSEYARGYYGGKSRLFSVRCVKD